MVVKQVSVFLENKSGRIYEVCKLLGEHNINIRAISIADSADFGILRMIVNDPDKAKDVLRENRHTVSITPVIAVKVPDKPGGLSEILKVLSEYNVNVEYVYGFFEKSGENAIIIFRVDEINKTLEIFEKFNISVLESSEVYNL